MTEYSFPSVQNRIEEIGVAYEIKAGHITVGQLLPKHGVYYFMSIPGVGCVSPEILRMIADKLEELNG